MGYTDDQRKILEGNVSRGKKGGNNPAPTVPIVEKKHKGKVPHEKVQKQIFSDLQINEMGLLPSILGVRWVKHIFEIKPFTAPRMSSSDKWKKRPTVTKYWEAKAELKKLCAEIGYELTPVLNVAFFIPMPETWSKKKKLEMLYMPHQQKPDKDNLEKAFMDSFSIDDSFVYDGRTCKFWSDKPMIVIF
jgi:Holliday junction resolvase RusA-like endonuclease